MDARLVQAAHDSERDIVRRQDGSFPRFLFPASFLRRPHTLTTQAQRC